MSSEKVHTIETEYCFCPQYRENELHGLHPKCRYCGFFLLRKEAPPVEKDWRGNPIED